MLTIDDIAMDRTGKDHFKAVWADPLVAPTPALPCLVGL
jgi:hypothetical protein